MTAEVFSAYERLQKEFNGISAGHVGDLQKCGELLVQLKLHLIRNGWLLPEKPEHTGDVERMVMSRDILEMGALHSILSKDTSSFERFMAQLRTYYHDFHAMIPVSQRMRLILGLNLLYLLSTGRLAEFHTELERLEPDWIMHDPFIQHAIQMERWWMDGNYNQIWNSRRCAPAPQYSLFFLELLVDAIRNDVADGAESAYESLPINIASTMMFFESPLEFTGFALRYGWIIDATQQRVLFSRPGSLHGTGSRHYANSVRRASLFHSVSGHALTGIRGSDERSHRLDGQASSLQTPRASSYDASRIDKSMEKITTDPTNQEDERGDSPFENVDKNERRSEQHDEMRWTSRVSSLGSMGTSAPRDPSVTDCPLVPGTRRYARHVMCQLLHYSKELERIV